MQKLAGHEALRSISRSGEGVEGSSRADAHACRRREVRSSGKAMSIPLKAPPSAPYNQTGQPLPQASKKDCVSQAQTAPPPRETPLRPQVRAQTEFGNERRSELMPRRGKRYRVKVLRKASALPITFRGGSSSGGGGKCGGSGGVDRVGGGVTGVTGHVGSGRGVTGGTGGGAGRTFIGGAGGGVGGNCGGARLPARDLTPRPGAPCFEGFARPVVFRVLLLEAREHVLRAVGGPEHQ